MKSTAGKSILKVRKVEERVAPGFEQLESKAAPAALWGSSK